MPSDTPTDGRCNEEVTGKRSDDGYCMNYPLKDADGEPVDGLCNQHSPEGNTDYETTAAGPPTGSQNAAGNSGGDGAPEFNDYAVKHDLRSDHLKYYERQSETDQKLISEMAESTLSRAPYPETDRDVVVACFLAAIDDHKRLKANDYIEEHGLIVENVVDYDEDGDPVVKKEENPANLPYARLSRDGLRTKKEYGALNDPDTQQAEADLAWAEAVRELAGDTDDTDDEHDDE